MDATCSRSPRSLGLASVGLVLALALAPPALLADPADHGLSFESRSWGTEASPPLPDPADFPIQLVLDDDQAEGVFGFAGNTARQFLWFNRFEYPGPFVMEEIWVLFPAGMDVPVGGAIELVVYLDDDGDPATGADLVGSWDDVIQAADGDTFSVYPVGPLSITNPGDVLVGVVNRFFETGIDPPPTQPAAVDTTASLDRSYFALWAGDPPVPPDLATATVVDVLDGSPAGNLMIRAFGTAAPAAAIPTLGGASLFLLGLLLAGAGLLLLRRP